MQVKKFEARTMKEALEMVKSQLGPEAIILNARDVRKGYGLVGQSSVEITAAISEESLRKLKFVESRIADKEREKLSSHSARTQKKTIDRFVSRYQSPANNSSRSIVPASRLEADRDVNAMGARKYIEIEDEPGELEAGGALRTSSSEERIKGAAQRAWEAMQASAAQLQISPKPKAVDSARVLNQENEGRALLEKEGELRDLRSELQEVRKMLADFQKVPQSFAQIYPGSKHGLPHEASVCFEKLTRAGIQEELVASILQEALRDLPPAKFRNKNLVDAWVAKKILDTTKVASLQTSGVHVFVGPAGLGKTSSLVKMAARLVLEHKKRVALVTCDTMKVGAPEQMRIFAQILNVPFAVLRSAVDWNLLKQKLQSVDVVLVDMPAWNLKSIEEIQSSKQLLTAFGFSKQIHLVVSALAKTADLREIIKRFSVMPLNDLIFTNLDQAVEFGNIYEINQISSLPLLAFGTGSQVPEDMEFASSERILDLLFQLSKRKKIEEKNG